MNIIQHPELIDRLAASYALGTLRGGARRRFETLAREHATVRAAALVWQTRWSGLTELQPAIDPGPAVWTRIDNLVQADKAAAALQAARVPQVVAAPGGWWRNLLVWRGAAAAGAIATLAAVVVGVQVNGGLRTTTGAQIAALQQQLQATPQIQYVAVLADDKAAAAMSACTRLSMRVHTAGAGSTAGCSSVRPDQRVCHTRAAARTVACSRARVSKRRRAPPRSVPRA